jgi:hypothetical protein
LLKKKKKKKPAHTHAQEELSHTNHNHCQDNSPNRIFGLTKKGKKGKAGEKEKKKRIEDRKSKKRNGTRTQRLMATVIIEEEKKEEGLVGLMAESSKQKPAEQASVTPFWAVALLTWITCFSLAVANNGIFYIAKSHFGFTALELFVLGLIAGVVWMVSPFSSVAIVRRVPERSFMIVLVVVMALVTPVPLVVDRILRHLGRSPDGASWTLYLLVTVFGLAVNLFWCISESYAASGRGKKVATYLTAYNITWCSALVAAFFTISFAVARFPL